MKVLEKLCLINRKLKLDKVNSTNAPVQYEAEIWIEQ